MMQSKPRKIALFGATGALGREFLKIILGGDYAVQALARSPKKLAPFDCPHLEIMQGDATSTADIRGLVRDSDLVVSCLGQRRGQPLFMAQAARDMLAAMAAQATPPHLIFISSIGCGDTSRLIRYLLMLIGGRAAFLDADRADAAIRAQSDVPYTLIRPYALTHKPGTGHYKLLAHQTTFAKPIARAYVAKVMLEAMKRPDWAGPKGLQLGG
jgi:uncharacterized protein YbjT (DUF2867 family)